MVAAVEHPEQLVAAWEGAGARLDDAIWAARIRGPFSWQGYVDWWAARRWVRPRDIRAE